MNCPQCQNEMKLIPAGYSQKKQRSYNAFFKCEACGTSQNAPIQGNGQQRPPQAPQQPQQRPQQPFNKDRSIHAQCAVKAACAYYSGQNVSPDEILLLASIFFVAFGRVAAGGSLGQSKPQAVPANYAQPDPGPPPEWTASHPDEPPPDDNDPWFPIQGERGRA